MKEHLLTIITASFNSEKTISRTIQSLLDQSFRHFEYIIIDGDSKDNTVEIIKSFEKEFIKKGINYKWVSEADQGIYDAWNKGINLSSGKWVSFIGSDDYYINNALSKYNDILSNNDKTFDWVYSNVKFIKDERSSRILSSEWSWKKFRRNISITPAHVGSFHNRKYFEKYGVFDISYKIAGDYELLLRARNNLRTVRLDEVTAIMSDGGVSNSMVKKVFKETLKAKHKTGRVNLFICYFDYCYAFLVHIVKKWFKI